MSNVKQKKIASSITKLLSEIIKDEVKDEVLKSITITDAKVAGDLSNAKVYFTSLLDMDHEELMKEVNKGAVFLRGQLANRINLNWRIQSSILSLWRRQKLHTTCNISWI